MTSADAFAVDPSRYGRIALILGGTSAERAISLKSGHAVLAALERLGLDVTPVDPAEVPGSACFEALDPARFDRAFVILHGRGGEDGQIQGALEGLGLPYTGSGVLGSAIGMDKYRSKLVWRGAGLPTAEFALIHGETDLKRAAALGFPLMVKPAHEGSSLGMARADGPDELASAWSAASELDAVVIAERWLSGAEYTCAILGEQALPLIRLETPRSFYDFEAKYQADSTSYRCPCGLPQALEAEYQRLCLQAFRSVGASGWGRVDFMLDEAGAPKLLEVNTIPGMTDHSLVPMAASAAGIDFEQLCLRILETSLRESAADD
ncbi:D-alanine--D-alanine ligase [Halochromatium glycolicum]|jgi:D-alanine-D-alanine ligase|uniref:D-alanine--D-alanine ligase n=1 Tax=Halochromatium glycolicum TaxID=85075 RepID=A0AAJ0U789_9GAMM|nr:D-alanine--D-alanine ligase [Halochromatium glycolicum]MBK1705777.1 D-alanine--D-alanine ligase [Halochromatium glycolicum]